MAMDDRTRRRLTRALAGLGRGPGAALLTRPQQVVDRSPRRSRPTGCGWCAGSAPGWSPSTARCSSRPARRLVRLGSAVDLAARGEHGAVRRLAPLRARRPGQRRAGCGVRGGRARRRAPRSERREQQQRGRQEQQQPAPRPAPPTARRRAAAPGARAAGRRGRRSTLPVIASAPSGTPAPPAPPAAATIACASVRRGAVPDSEASATSSARISTSSRTAACARAAAGSTGSAASQATNGSSSRWWCSRRCARSWATTAASWSVVQLGHHPRRQHQQRPGARDAEGDRRRVLEQPGVRQLRRRPDDELEQLPVPPPGPRRPDPRTARRTPSSSKARTPARVSATQWSPRTGSAAGCAVTTDQTASGSECPQGARPCTSRAPIIDSPPASPIACQQTSATSGSRRGQRARASSAGTGHASSAARTARDDRGRGQHGLTGSAGVTSSGCRRAARAACAPRPASDAADEAGQHGLPVAGLAEHLVHQLGGVVLAGGPGARSRAGPRVVVDDEALLLQPGQHRVHGGQRDPAVGELVAQRRSRRPGRRRPTAAP